MDALHVVCYLLAALNLFQFIFWSRQVHGLIDKLMSRNYAEYVASKAYKPSQKSSPTASSDVPDDMVLNELNGLLGG